MLDFLTISSRLTKGKMEIYPKFKIIKSKDLMIRGGDFYAIWDEETKLWSTDEDTVIRLIDNELNDYYMKHKTEMTYVSHMWDADSGIIDRWHKYCQKQMRDNYHNLDEKIVFANDEVEKKDYASHKLDYDLAEGDISAYEEMVSTLYSEVERRKFEWAIGSIINGDSKKIQKFCVFYGEPGSGKGTILKIIDRLFKGYTCEFCSADLGSKTAAFALEPFRNNPLVAIEQDGNLSRIETNTRLNSLISHEKMIVNEKYTKQYSNEFKAFLFIGSNSPVKITDSKSGLLRRLIDISPTGNKIPKRAYDALDKRINFELGAIAKHCLDVYEDDPSLYDLYIPETMMYATNDFYNFINENYLIFSSQEDMTLNQAFKLYDAWAEASKLGYVMKKTAFKEELKSYYKEFYDHAEGKWNLYKGFDISKFEKSPVGKSEETKPTEDWLDMKEQHSLLDDYLADCKAQLTKENGKPIDIWDKVKTFIKNLDTKKLHYCLVPASLIVIDFDKKNKKGEKDFELNKQAAIGWPKTYAELSQGGQGIHLHYLYHGDVSKLEHVFDNDPDIEIKVFPADKKASLRRRVSKCNDTPIATLSSGLPFKEEKGKKTMVDPVSIQSVQSLRRMIQRNLNKEIHSNTASSVQFIYKILEDAYASGLTYDVTDMRNSILAFAAGSTHQADNCLRLVSKMKFKSESEVDNAIKSNKDTLVFFDCEVFPNLLLVNWKVKGKNKPMVRMINPTPEEVEELFKMNLVGFNCRKYDNHILYARSMGWSNQQIFDLSQRIIAKQDRDALFGEAYNISYTDVYDFASKKQSLKKWEVELGIHHQELGLPWDQPVPEEMWEKVAKYCDNDVISTEAVFDAIHSDFIAREILATVAGGSVNDTTNTLTGKLIFGKDRHPQAQFNYRFLGDPADWTWKEATAYALGKGPKPEGKPWFPGYSFVNGHSTYRDVDGKLLNGDPLYVGEGGYVYAQPGFWGNIRTQDVASMHPHSVIAEVLFGDTYTKIFKQLVDTRVLIKHKDFEAAKKMFDGKLAPYLDDPKIAKDLSYALKIAINSVYGLTSAKFPNLFKDERNIDNIVAKRGALFMIDLRHFVQDQGFQVAHIKTDSIKIPDITDDMIEKVRRFGECYGYTFETEADFEKFCLVNKAVYIAKERVDGGYVWEATGAQFQRPYVFKKLFSHEPIEFADKCIVAEVKNAAIYLDFNEKDNDIHDYRFVGRIGSFCPIKDGEGGALCLRSSDQEKYDAVAGTKGYRWMESEMVKKVKEDDIDTTYFDDLCEEAKADIQAYVDFNWFASDEPYIPPKFENGIPVYPDVVPFDTGAGDEQKKGA